MPQGWTIPNSTNMQDAPELADRIRNALLKVSAVKIFLKAPAD
jgi:hypothetical protein